MKIEGVKWEEHGEGAESSVRTATVTIEDGDTALEILVLADICLRRLGRARSRFRRGS